MLTSVDRTARNGAATLWTGALAFAVAAMLSLACAGGAFAQELAGEPVSDAFSSSAGNGSSTSATSGATVASDKDDYPPGGHVVLSGAGWQPGESVHIHVEDDQNKTWSRSVNVVADDQGSIVDEFDLPNWFVATYAVTATGAQSGVATTSFTDADLNMSGPDAAVAGTTGNYSYVVQGGGCNVSGAPQWSVSGPATLGQTANQTASVSYTAPGTVVVSAQVAGVGSNGRTPCTVTGSKMTSVTAAPQRSTTTTVASSKTPSAYGDSVTFTAFVTSAAGNPSGVGTVTF